MGTIVFAQNISIQMDGGSFRVIGWKAPATPPAKGWASLFPVYAGTGDVPPLLGTYRVEGELLTFRPTYPITPGVRYRAVFQLPGSTVIEKTFDAPRRDVTPTARVTQI